MRKIILFIVMIVVMVVWFVPKTSTQKTTCVMSDQKVSCYVNPTTIMLLQLNQKVTIVIDKTTYSGVIETIETEPYIEEAILYPITIYVEHYASKFQQFPVLVVFSGETSPWIVNVLKKLFHT